MVGVEVRGPHAPVIGFEFVRGGDGRFRILEDNCLNPSGIAYALAARTAIDAFVPLQPPTERRDIAYAVELLARVIRAASPKGEADPSAALISEGEENGAWFEHVALAAVAGKHGAEGADHVGDREQAAVFGDKEEEIPGQSLDLELLQDGGERSALFLGGEDGALDEPSQVLDGVERFVEMGEVDGDLLERVALKSKLE
jgi:hypothetical protein